MHFCAWLSCHYFELHYFDVGGGGVWVGGGVSFVLLLGH